MKRAMALNNGSVPTHSVEAVRRCPILTDLTKPQASRETEPKTSQKCPKLTGSKTGQLSQINRLSIGLIWDIAGISTSVPYRARGTPLIGFSLGP